jgi:hypothetical protein
MYSNCLERVNVLLCIPPIKDHQFGKYIILRCTAFVPYGKRQSFNHLM